MLASASHNVVRTMGGCSTISDAPVRQPSWRRPDGVDLTAPSRSMCGGVGVRGLVGHDVFRRGVATTVTRSRWASVDAMMNVGDGEHLGTSHAVAPSL